jgi:hypothetical protein
MDDTFEKYFRFCDWNNPVFYYGVIWFAIFCVTSVWTLYFKIGDSIAAQVTRLEKEEPSVKSTKLGMVKEEKHKKGKSK